MYSLQFSLIVTVVEKMTAANSDISLLQRFFWVTNTLFHSFLGIITFFMYWIVLRNNDAGPTVSHVLFSSVAVSTLSNIIISAINEKVNIFNITFNFLLPKLVQNDMDFYYFKCFLYFNIILFLSYRYSYNQTL